MPTSTKYIYSNGLFSFKNNILESLRTQIFTKEAVKLIFHFAHNTSLKNTIRSNNANFYRLYLPKWFILFLKQYFGIFKNSNIYSGSKQINKNDFLSCTSNLSVKQNNISHLPCPCFKIVSQRIILVKRQAFPYL